jgi:hypothetical protein
MRGVPSVSCLDAYTRGLRAHSSVVRTWKWERIAHALCWDYHQLNSSCTPNIIGNIDPGEALLTLPFRLQLL